MKPHSFRVFLGNYLNQSIADRQAPTLLKLCKRIGGQASQKMQSFQVIYLSPTSVNLTVSYHWQSFIVPLAQ